jgi:coenzyme F420-dependent glucose-6-phosphate dehydrogenase
MDVRYFYFCAHEQFGPAALLEHAIVAERQGFEGIACSDHLQPWWEPGESANAWVWLGAAGRATSVPIGTGVTPPGARYHPVLIAQAWATLECLFPGRPYLGIGSGESLNESPLGGPWPSVAEQQQRLVEALELIHRLFAGERVTHHGKHFRTDQAYLHTRPERRPPIFVSAFGPKAAAIAARWGDGMWTLGDPEMAPEVIDAYRAACDDLGRETGEIVLQGMFSWAPDDESALEGARVWKGAQPKEFYRGDWHEPAKMYEYAEQHVSDDDLREAIVISSDPQAHIEGARKLEQMGATIVVLANASGADPLGAIEVYGEHVLPALRGLRVHS